MKIFKHLGFATRRTILPLVCKQWLKFTEHSNDLWAEVEVSKVEEKCAFQILQRADRTGGLVLSVEVPLHILRAPVVRWFQRHAGAAISSFDLGYFQIAQVPQDIALLTYASSFNGVLIKHCSSLEHLRIYDTERIRAEPYFSDLGWLTKLKSLTLVVVENVNLTAEDLSGLTCLSNLESLDLELSGLRRSVIVPFPDAIFELPKLKHLELTNICGGGFSDRLGRMTGLTTLGLLALGEGAESAAQQAASLPGLVTLDLSQNPSLRELPDLSALCALRTLRCARCGFASLPVDRLRALPAVEELDFSKCAEMAILENVADLAELRHLRLLSVRGCKPTGEGFGGMLRFQDALRTRSPNLTILVESRDLPDIPKVSQNKIVFVIHV